MMFAVSLCLGIESDYSLGKTGYNFCDLERREVKYLSLLAVAIGLSGCQQVQSNVTKFDNLPAEGQGRTVAFIPLDAQNGSAAWLSYTNQIASGLASSGYQRIDARNVADYFAVIEYGAGDTRTTTASVPIWGQTGGGTAYTSGTVSGSGGFASYNATTTVAPTYGVTGYVPVTSSETDRFFSLKMIDLRKSTPGNLYAAYEAAVVSSGSSRTFEEVGSCMIKALMDDFRGSGSDTTTIARADC
ncbi:MAG: hypothetical protein WD969_15330 [Paracoccaceae bacterium]